MNFNKYLLLINKILNNKKIFIYKKYLKIQIKINIKIYYF